MEKQNMGFVAQQEGCLRSPSILPLTAILRDSGNLVKDGAVYHGVSPVEGFSFIYGDGPIIECLYAFCNHHDENLDWFGLKGQVVVDIGSGPTAHGYLFAQLTGAKAYIAVEGYCKKTTSRSIMALKLENPIPACVIGEDMLHALRRFHSGTVSVLAINVDKDLLWSHEDRYAGELAHQITRVTHPKGVFISCVSKYNASLTPYGPDFNVEKHPTLKYLYRFSRSDCTP